MKKKILTYLIAAVIVTTGFAGCGNKVKNASDSAIEVAMEETMEESSRENTSKELNSEDTDLKSNDSIENESKDTAEFVVSESKEETVSYTYTELSATMFAKADVNKRDLPSTDGNRVGVLSKGQEVKVIGKCNETGWYELEDHSYVSGSYLVKDKPAEKTVTNVASNVASTIPSTNTNATSDAQGENAVFATEITSAEAGVTTESAPEETLTTSLASDMLALINDARAAEGLNSVVWDSGLDSIVQNRAMQISTDFSHRGNVSAVENIAKGYYTSADVFNAWMSSPGHRSNILYPQLSGVSVARYGNCWVLDGSVSISE